MSDLGRNPEDRFSHDVAHIKQFTKSKQYQRESRYNTFSNANMIATCILVQSFQTFWYGQVVQTNWNLSSLNWIYSACPELSEGHNGDI